MRYDTPRCKEPEDGSTHSAETVGNRLSAKNFGLTHQRLLFFESRHTELVMLGHGRAPFVSVAV